MGQPFPSNVGKLPDEYIVWIERTGGSETSQYPQEEKVITIALVVASERAIA